jgi:hypothetical protein
MRKNHPKARMERGKRVETPSSASEEIRHEEA